MRPWRGFQFGFPTSLQAKVSLVLVAVVVPTSVGVALLQSKLISTGIQEEGRQLGVSSAKTLVAEIIQKRLLSGAPPLTGLESYLQEFVYNQPSVVRIDVMTRDPASGEPKLVASTIEEDPGTPAPLLPWVESVQSQLRVDEIEGDSRWEVFAPIELPRRDPRAPRRILGTVGVTVSLKLATRIEAAVWRITAGGALLTVAILIGFLSFFLRRTFENEERLVFAENRNLALTEKLLGLQRELMNLEKLAVMGQLTAQFAHEIGTPLNAIGGHLELLRGDLKKDADPGSAGRLEIIRGQVERIEGIVRSFLRSTGRPSMQRQLLDLREVVERALALIAPRAEAHRIELRRRLPSGRLPSVRVVPGEIEQILLNLMNNSLDSLQASGERRSERFLEVSLHAGGGGEVELRVRDSGEGISAADLKEVWKPFFTTKSPAEGTGLGLTICRELAARNQGELDLESVQGVGTTVILRLKAASEGSS
jgi:signal transduction histidine kinase